MAQQRAHGDYAYQLLAGIRYDLEDETAGGRILPLEDATAYYLAISAIHRVSATGPFENRDDFEQRVSDEVVATAGANHNLASLADDIVFGAGIIYDLHEGLNSTNG